MLLLPLSWLYRAVVAMRRTLFIIGLKEIHHLDVPVIIVGNITVGGTGKTPVAIWLAGFLKRLGYTPGIVARGYRGRATHWPQLVEAGSDPLLVGDEPVLLARCCQCPVAVAPNRVNAAQSLLAEHRCDILISDDGLQHYALGRDVEIAVIDGVRRFGNGHCLPAGPLREPVSRLRQVDLVLVTEGRALENEFSVRIEANAIVNIKQPQQSRTVTEMNGQLVHAVAGIGHPQRFFAQLRALGFDIIEHAFPDHHYFTDDDLSFEQKLPILMTAKDAVKCRNLNIDDGWYLSVSACPDARIENIIQQALQTVKKTAIRSSQPAR